MSKENYLKELQNHQERLRDIPQNVSKGKSVIVVGTQWGDEGKGKIIDALAEKADCVVRFQGGSNAGHTVVVNDAQYVLHQVPSGAVNKGVKVALAPEVALNANSFVEECNVIPENFNLMERLKISYDTHLVTPLHLEQDTAHEKTGKGVGSTRKGMRPCYEDRRGRRAVTAGQVLFEPNLALSQIEKQVLHWDYRGKSGGAIKRHKQEIDAKVQEIFNLLYRDLLQFKDNIIDVSVLVGEILSKGGNVLYEGAQGTLLDVIHGSYPYVTSSNTVSGGVCTSVGVGPTTINEVVGVVKAVMTRVGKGSFPTELVNEKLQEQELLIYTCQSEGVSLKKFNHLEIEQQYALRKKWSKKYNLSSAYEFIVKNMAAAEEFLDGKKIEASLKERLEKVLIFTRERMKDADPSKEHSLRDSYHHILGMHMMQKAGEFGATTGRPRRIGWLDLGALNYAKRVNGLTGIAISKLDCLGDLPQVKVQLGYDLDRKLCEMVPLRDKDKARPVYETFSGWNSAEVRKARCFEELPLNAQNYITKIAEHTGLRIYLVGVGPSREETIHLHHPFTNKGIYEGL